MKARSDHWGPVRAGSGCSAALRIDVAAEIAESRAFTERLFVDYRSGGYQRGIETLRRVGWPLRRRERAA